MRVWFNTVVRGDVHYIRIGSDTCIQDNSTLHVTGRNTRSISGTAYYRPQGDSPRMHRRRRLHDGMGAIILDGAKIGRGSVIAADRSVPQGFDVPPESVVMGVPAKLKRQAGEAERELIRHSWSHYADLAADYLGEDKLRTGEIKDF